MNFRLTAKDVRFILFILMILLFTFTKSFAVTKISAASGSWTTASTWSPSGAPASTDDIIISNGHTITFSANTTCRSLTFSDGTVNSTLSVTGTTARTLTVTNAITFLGASGAGVVKAITCASNMNITCGSIVMPNTTGGAITRISSTGGSITVSGSINLSGDVDGENNITSTSTTPPISIGGDFISPITVNIGSFRLYLTGTANQNICSFTQASGSRFYNSKSGGTATMTGNFTCGQYRLNTAGGTLDLGIGLNHTIQGNLTNTSGTLNCNSSTLNLSSTYSGTTGTINTNNSTIKYIGTNQNMIPITYNNLTLSNSGAKTFPTGTTTINGNLTLEGTATATVTGTLNFGASAGIIYDKANHITGNEWPNPFNGSAGITILSGTVTLGANETLGADVPLTISSGATLTTGASNFDLSLNGPVTNNGTFVPNNSNIIYSSENEQNIIPADYYNLTLNGAGTKTVTSATTVSNELDVNAGTLATGGFLTLTSNATNTARLGTASGTITGNVTVQRFIPGGTSKRKWRFLSSPVNVSGSIELSQYIDDIFVTAPAGSAAGFDDNPFGNNSSIRTYDESLSGASSNGWTDPTDITNTISTGLGAEVFVRGSRSLTDPFLNWTTPDDVTIDFIGALNTGTISPTITYTPSVGGASTSDGFNLVGNPYASSINFTHSGLTKTNIDDKFWCYNPNTSSYGIYDAGLGDSTNGITRFIASGQAFFIRANAASPAITFTENIKCTAVGNNYFKGTNSNQNIHSILHIIASNDSNYRDEALIVQDETASCFSGDEHDAGKLFNDALNVYTLSDDNVNMTINALPCIRDVDTIGLAIFSYNGSAVMTSTHKFEFTGIDNFPSTKKIYLLDQFTNTLTKLTNSTTYTFNITNDKASWGKSRFKLLLANSTLGIQTKNTTANVELFPNPASTELNLKFNSEFNNSYTSYQIIDVFGRIILEGENVLENQILKINVGGLPNGRYIVKVISKTESCTLQFIK